MTSKKSHEGYFMSDMRGTPGVSDQLAHQLGMPVGSNTGLYEVALLICRHCQAGVLKNPDRTRVRAYCPKCDHYICDNCGAIRAANGGLCKTFAQVIDEIQEAAALNEQSGSDLIVPARVWAPGQSTT